MKSVLLNIALTVCFSYTAAQAAEASGSYKNISDLTVHQGQIPTALAVGGNTVAVGFASNVTQLYRLTDAPAAGTTSISAYQHACEENPRTVGVAFLPDDRLCTVNRMGSVAYMQRPYNVIQHTQCVDRATFCMKATKDLLCLGCDNDTALVFGHDGLLKRKFQGKAS